MQNLLRTVIGPFGQALMNSSLERAAQEHVDAGKRACWHFTQWSAFNAAASTQPGCPHRLRGQPCLHKVCSCLQGQELWWDWCMVRLHHFPTKGTKTLFTQIHPLAVGRGCQEHSYLSLLLQPVKLSSALHGANTLPIKQLTSVAIPET